LSYECPECLEGVNVKRKKQIFILIYGVLVIVLMIALKDWARVLLAAVVLAYLLKRFIQNDSTETLDKETRDLDRRISEITDYFSQK
jgi:hypothetical protein